MSHPRLLLPAGSPLLEGVHTLKGVGPARRELLQRLGIVPTYPMTEDLHPEALRNLMRQAVDQFAGLTTDIVPERLLRERHFPALHAAFRNVHFPASLEAAKAARQRFTYEEFLVLQAALALKRRDLRDR